MSHFTTVETKITNLTALEAAARQLGLNVKRDAEVRDWAGNRLSAPMVIPLEHYDVAVTPATPEETHSQKLGRGLPTVGQLPIATKPLQTYELVADFDMLEDHHIIGRNGQKLLQEYSCQVVQQQARLMGYRATRQAEPDGSVRMVLRGVR